MNLLHRLFKVLCVVVATHGAVFVAAQELSVVKPRKAGDFVNSIGVNTHFGYYDTTYGMYEQILKPRLLELGVKHIRDGTYNQDVVRKYREVGQAGVRLLLITSSDRAVSQAKTIGDMLWGVEAVNEPDMRRYEGGWVKFACREQQNLYQAIKRDSELNHIPVVGLSLANIRRSPSELGDISQWMDYGGMHPYAAGEYPSKHWGWGMSMESALGEARKVSGDKPLLVTECGYHNRIAEKGHPGVSEQAAAIYHLHLFFIYFNQGVERSYKYELLDLKDDKEMSDKECHFGLVRSDGSVKPSFTAIKNLIWLLDDEKKDFRCRDLEYAVESDAVIRTTLLQKSDGSWWLALMREVDVFDLKSGQDIAVEPIKVSVKFARKMDVCCYKPNLSVEPTAEWESVRSVECMMDGCVQLLRIEK